MLMRSFWLALLAAVLTSLVACSGGAGRPVTGHRPVTGTTTGTNQVSGPPQVQVSVVLDEQANHTDVTVHVGSRVELLLHSDYWTIHGSSQPAVLEQNGPTLQLPRTPPTCPPGVGCNPLETLFTALRPGTAVINASRTTCGEALLCLKDQRTYTVTVTVTG